MPAKSATRTATTPTGDPDRAEVRRPANEVEARLADQEARLENLEVILRDPVKLAEHLHWLLASQAREVQA